jgi:hypothetical protein
MHLLLGNSQDICCVRVSAALAAKGCQAQLVSNPLLHSRRFSWWLDTWNSSTHLDWDGKQPTDDGEIESVLVRNLGFSDPDGWQADDLAYIHAETQAGLLGWLWSLDCPVINRYPASIWCRPQAALPFWQPLLKRCGIPAIELLVSNVEKETRAFGRRLGAVYAPLTGDACYLVATEDEWVGLAAFQHRCAPVSLTQPHGTPHFACVIDKRVVWEGDPPDASQALESALRRFGVAAGLAFVEVILADTPQGIQAIAIEPQPHLEHFGDVAQEQIVDGLIELLTVEPQVAISTYSGRLS